MTDYDFPKNWLIIGLKLKKLQPQDWSLLLEKANELFVSNKNEISINSLQQKRINRIRKLYPDLVVTNNNLQIVNRRFLLFLFSFHLTNIINGDFIYQLNELLGIKGQVDWKLNHIDNDIFTADYFILISHLRKSNILKEIINSGSCSDTMKFWGFYTPLCNCIPFLDKTNYKDILYLFELIHPILVNNLANYKFFDAISKLTEFKPFTGIKLFNIILTNRKDEGYNLIPYIILGLSVVKGDQYAFNKIKNLLGGKSLEVRTGLFTLSKIDFSSNPYVKYFPQVINYAVQFNNSSQYDILAESVHLLGVICNYDNSLFEKLGDISVIKDINVQNQLCNILHINAVKHNGEEWFSVCLLNMTDIEIKYKGVLQILSFILMELAYKNPQLILLFLFKWIVNHPIENSEDNIGTYFYHFFEEYSRTPHFQTFITKTLLEKDSIYHSNLVNIFSQIGFPKEDGYVLDKQILDQLSDKEINYLITKVMGYILMNNHLQSMTFSVLAKTVVSKNIEKMVEEAFKVYILYNYPVTTAEFLKLKEISGNEVEKRLAKRILKYQKAVLAGRNNLQRLLEFKSPKMRTQRYRYLERKKNQEIMEKPQPLHAPLLSLIHKTKLKGGKAWFSRLNDGNYSSISPLAELKYEYELPSGELINPLEQQLFRYNCRLLEKEDY